VSFREEPLVVRVYVLAVSIAGIIFLYYHLPPRELVFSDFIYFVLLRILLEQLDIPLPQGDGAVSVSCAVDSALIILFGPAAAAWACLSTLIHIQLFKNFKDYWYKMFFNTSQMVLAVGFGGHAFILCGGTVGSISLPGDILPILASIFVSFLCNMFLFMTALSLASKKSFISVWTTNIRWGVPNYLATLPLGLLIAGVYLNVGIIGVLLLIIPLMVARHTFIMYMDMRNQYTSTIKVLTKAIDAKDHYTHGHSERVARLAVLIGQEMCLPEDFLEKLEYLALMHDIGKIGIPEQILNKPSRLSDDEFNLVREHAAVGAEIIENIKHIGEHADIVRHHHERVDGKGYPDGLTGEKISLGAKIVCVADAFDAMTTERVYRRPMTKEEAARELVRCANTQFCEEVVNAFIRVLRRRGEIK
jgi:hypothetical protein